MRPGDDLAALIGDAVERAGGLEQGDVVVVAQKVVSKAEGRVEQTDDHLEVILREARAVRRRRGDLVIAETEHGFVCASAGRRPLEHARGRLGRAPARATRTPRPRRSATRSPTASASRRR